MAHGTSGISTDSQLFYFYCLFYSTRNRQWEKGRKGEREELSYRFHDDGQNAAQALDSVLNLSIFSVRSKYNCFIFIIISLSIHYLHNKTVIRRGLTSCRLFTHNHFITIVVSRHKEIQIHLRAISGASIESRSMLRCVCVQRILLIIICSWHLSHTHTHAHTTRNDQTSISYSHRILNCS